MKYNIREKGRSRVQATRMKLPDWAGRARELIPAGRGTLPDKITSLGDDTLRVRALSSNKESDEFSPSALMGSGIYDDPVTLDYTELSDWARETTPVEDEPDVTDWMVPAKAQVSHLRARAREYDRAGSSLTVASGDPFTPGVNNGQIAFKSERGTTISDKGEATVVAGDDEIAVRAPGSETIVTPDVLGWSSATDIQDKQWVGSLMSVEEITNNPSRPIAFPRIGEDTGPMFVGHRPSRPSVLNRTSVSFESDTEQTVTFRLRNSQDYTKINTEFTQTIPKGSSVVNFRLLALGINPMVAEIQPENKTKTVLTDYTVYP